VFIQESLLKLDLMMKSIDLEVCLEVEGIIRTVIEIEYVSHKFRNTGRDQLSLR
jgi:hypothetical protein